MPPTETKCECEDGRVVMEIYVSGQGYFDCEFECNRCSGEGFVLEQVEEEETELISLGA